MINLLKGRSQGTEHYDQGQQRQEHDRHHSDLFFAHNVSETETPPEGGVGPRC
jgi:hypothetical protein